MIGLTVGMKTVANCCSNRLKWINKKIKKKNNGDKYFPSKIKTSFRLKEKPSKYFRKFIQSPTLNAHLHIEIQLLKPPEKIVLKDTLFLPLI